MPTVNNFRTYLKWHQITETSNTKSITMNRNQQGFYMIIESFKQIHWILDA